MCTGKRTSSPPAASPKRCSTNSMLWRGSTNPSNHIKYLSGVFGCTVSHALTEMKPHSPGDDRDGARVEQRGCARSIPKCAEQEDSALPRSLRQWRRALVPGSAQSQRRPSPCDSSRCDSGAARSDTLHDDQCLSRPNRDSIDRHYYETNRCFRLKWFVSYQVLIRHIESWSQVVGKL